MEAIKTTAKYLLAYGFLVGSVVLAAYSNEARGVLALVGILFSADRLSRNLGIRED